MFGRGDYRSPLPFASTLFLLLWDMCKYAAVFSARLFCFGINFAPILPKNNLWNR
jgi:hypothetical protein